MQPRLPQLHPFRSFCRRGCGSTRRGANMHLETESSRHTPVPVDAWSPCAEHLFSNGLFLLLRRLPGGWMEERKFREPAFYGAPRTASMHSATSEHINGSQPHHACWRHAEWARTVRQSRVLRGTNIFTVNWKRTHLSCAGAPMGHFSSLRRNRMGVFGKGVQGENPFAKGIIYLTFIFLSLALWVFLTHFHKVLGKVFAPWSHSDKVLCPGIPLGVARGS